MNSYDSIARIIRYLDEHQSEQPDLETLAGHADLSPFHFHRLFSIWAAITPKDFLQCLTLEHAKDLLRQGQSVFDAALSTGLSGGARLHDLCITLEAATPGELKAGGAGWTIVAGYAESPFGRCLLARNPRGICHLRFVDGDDGWEALKAEWPRAAFERNDTVAAGLARQVFARRTESEAPRLRAFVRGTAFQVRVWRALLRVRSGTLVSYRRLAEAIGHPAAARAVGSAVGANPLAYLIPCHRVIRETGAVGEYRWGPLRKRAMLAWESRASRPANLTSRSR
jgi:AraC family transcriptional regulator, regulatory protein of adaptative response / methylated-DNA-[protein]-cysteine methyltransferase